MDTRTPGFERLRVVGTLCVLAGLMSVVACGGDGGGGQQADDRVEAPDVPIDVPWTGETGVDPGQMDTGPGDTAEDGVEVYDGAGDILDTVEHPEAVTYDTGDGDEASLEEVPDVQGEVYAGCEPNDLDCTCSSDEDCDPSFSGFCGENRCNKVLGTCLIAPIEKDGTPCDNGDPCTLDDACDKGLCKGTSNPCDDLNSCTEDSCETMVGCVHEAVGGACEDGDFCHGPDLCQDGQCLAGPEIDCDDKNVCTTDSCSPDSGCAHEPNSESCDDGNACTTGDHCEGGGCSFSGVLDCSDEEPCTLDSCDPDSGCAHQPLDEGSCDDGDDCTQGDFCEGGVCQPGPIKECYECGDGVCDEPFEDCASCSKDCECPEDCFPGDLVGCGAVVTDTTKGWTNAIENYFNFTCFNIIPKEGPERVIPFRTYEAVHTLVTLEGAGSSLYVLSDNCNPSSCVTQGKGLPGLFTQAAFTPDPGEYYFLTVDGDSTEGAPFTLTTDCFEAACGDGLDNDEDGATDCSDPDCGGEDVTCGQIVSRETGPFSHAHGYSASCGNLAGAGIDAVFRLSLDQAATVTLTIVQDNSGDDLDLFVMQEGCTGSACMAFGTGSSSIETVVFPGQPGTFHVVVEEVSTALGSSGGFTLNVQCQ